MVNKISLTDLASSQASSIVAAVNANNLALGTAMDKTLSRDGTGPNSMAAILDMNSNPIINLPVPLTASEPVRKAEFDVLKNAVSSIGTSPNIRILATRAAVNATSISTLVNTIFVQGFSVEGVGGTVYNKLTTPPSVIMPWHLQSLDGAWWQIAVPSVTLEMFGGVGDLIVVSETAANGPTNVAAFLNAIEYLKSIGGGIINLASATMYNIPAMLDIVSAQNIIVRGDGSTLRAPVSRIVAIVKLTGCANFMFDGVIFDMRQPDLTTYLTGDYPNDYQVGIFATGGSDKISVTRCQFKNLYTKSIYCNAVTNITIYDNFFTSPLQTQSFNLQHVNFLTVGGSIKIVGNVFDNTAYTNPAVGVCGITISGASTQPVSTTIENNNFNYCGRDNTGTHRLGVIDFYGDVANVTVRNNTSRNTMAQFMRLSSCRNGAVLGNRISYSANAESGYSCITVESTVAFPAQLGCQNIIVSQNVIEDLSSRCAFAIGALSYDWGAPSTAVKISDNIFYGAIRSIIVYGPFSGVEISRNVSRAGTGAIEVSHNGTNASLVTATQGTEANSVFRGLKIFDNDIINSAGGLNAGLSINLNKTPTYTGTVKDIDVKRNVFSASSAHSGQGIACIINASVLSGLLRVVENLTENYTYDVYVRSTLDVLVKDHQALLTGTAFYLDDGSNGSVTKTGNRLGSGVRQGTATLVAGTVTISTNEIRTGDTVIISRQTAGGTVGDLRLGTITNATSFVINSASGTDTSTVFWKIEH